MRNRLCRFLLLLAVPCALAHGEAVRIMPLGDSITQGSRRHDSYRWPLWQQLEQAGHAVDFVGSSSRNYLGGPPHDDFDRDHEGHWGWRASRVLGYLPAWAADARPDVVLVHLGSNDIFRGATPDDVVADLRAIIGLLREANPRVAVLVARIIPAAGRARPIAAFNERMQELAREDRPDARVIVVDQFAGFDPDTHTYDGVHPNALGEQQMAARWFAALQELLPTTPSP